MKKWSKRLGSVFLAAVMVLGLAACGDRNQGNGATSEDAKKFVYRMQDIETDALSNDNLSINAQAYVDGRIYVLASENRWDEMRGIKVSLISFNEDGGDVQTTELFNTLRSNPDYMPDDGNMDMPPEGEIMPLTEDVPIEVVEPREEDTTEDATEEDPADAENAEDGTAASEDAQIMTDSYVNSCVLNENGLCMVLERTSYYYDDAGNYNDAGYSLEMYSYSLTGEERGKVVLSEDQENYMWVQSMASDKDGNMAVMTNEKLLMFDAQGKPLSEVDTSNQGYIQNMFVGRDGKLKMVTYNDDWTKMYLKVFNFQTKSFEDDIELPGNLTNYGIMAGNSYDLMLTNSQGIYGYNIGDADITQILSYINSDIDGTSMNQIIEAEEGKLIGTYYDAETGSTRFALLTYVDPSEIPDKEVITLACYWLDYDMRKRIVAFNKESNQYRILVMDYSTYSTADDYTAGYTQLNNDILAGQVPDILVLDSNMPIDSYIAKGVLADIGKLIDEDEELNRDDYLTNVFDAYSVDGKLYSVIPSFTIQTVLGKTADVGDTPGWTMEDLRALMEARPNASVFGDTMTRDSVMWQLMMYSGSQFVDRNTGKCSFDTQEFIDALEFAAQFPKEFNWEDLGDDYWMSSRTQYRDGRTLLMNTGIYDFQEYNRTVKGNFGEPVTPIGFPAKEGNGAVLSAGNQYGIAAKSKNLEGAWDFLRYYLTEEYQTGNQINYILPVYKEALLAKLEAAQERPYWENEDGTREYYDDYYWIGDEDIIIEPMTKEEADAMYEYVSSITMAYYYDESLMNIITEEAAAFFEGQKSAAEVASIIQGRAQVYISENR